MIFTICHNLDCGDIPHESTYKSQLRNTKISWFGCSGLQFGRQPNLLIHNNIIFVGPLDMIKALAQQAAAPSFWATILNSFARISLGFLGAFFLSILLGSLAYLFPLVKDCWIRSCC